MTPTIIHVTHAETLAAQHAADAVEQPGTTSAETGSDATSGSRNHYAAPEQASREASKPGPEGSGPAVPSMRDAGRQSRARAREDVNTDTPDHPLATTRADAAGTRDLFGSQVADTAEPAQPRATDHGTGANLHNAGHNAHADGTTSAPDTATTRQRIEATAAALGIAPRAQPHKPGDLERLADAARRYTAAVAIPCPRHHVAACQPCGPADDLHPYGYACNARVQEGLRRARARHATAAALQAARYAETRRPASRERIRIADAIHAAARRQAATN